MALKACRASILSGLMTLAAATPLAGEVVDAGRAPLSKGLDLSFPDAPQRFGYAKANRMFKPEGPGPFPGLVILPVCSGHAGWYNAFDWAKAALQRNYAVLVVDPLTPRGAGVENCHPPQKVNLTRFRKDGFDAGEHLRKQPFVDRNRIGLLGLSLGAMAGLSASGEDFARADGRPAFSAIVAIYPICFLSNFRSPSLNRVIDVRFIPAKVVVPLQVQMGALDTEAPPSDCVPVLQAQKDRGAPIDFIVHKNATHNWDAAALGKETFRKTGLVGQAIMYRYNPEVTVKSFKLALDFLDRHVRAK